MNREQKVNNMGNGSGALPTSPDWVSLQVGFGALRKACLVAAQPLRKAALERAIQTSKASGAPLRSTLSGETVSPYEAAAGYGGDYPLERAVCEFMLGTARMPEAIALTDVGSGAYRFANDEDREDFIACHEYVIGDNIAVVSRSESSTAMKPLDWEVVQPHIASVRSQLAADAAILPEGNLAFIRPNDVDLSRARVVPAGSYMLKITGHEWRSANDGNLSLQLNCVVVAPVDYAGPVRPIHLNVVCSNHEAQEHAVGMLKAILRQAGLDRLGGAEDLHGKVITSQMIVKHHGHFGTPENDHRVVAFAEKF